MVFFFTLKRKKKFRFLFCKVAVLLNFSYFHQLYKVKFCIILTFNCSKKKTFLFWIKLKFFFLRKNKINPWRLLIHCSPKSIFYIINIWMGTTDNTKPCNLMLRPISDWKNLEEVVYLISIRSFSFLRLDPYSNLSTRGFFRLVRSALNLLNSHSTNLVD